MNARHLQHSRRLLAATLASLAALCCASVASAQATIGPISWQDTLAGTEVGIVGCYPDLSGTLTGTDTGTGKFVLTKTGVHFEGVETQTYRIDFANGWYLLSSSPTHFSANFNVSSGQSENTFAQQDRGTLYDANGQMIGSIDVRNVAHLTWRDHNGNGQPDPGEITANVNLFRLSCP